MILPGLDASNLTDAQALVLSLLVLHLCAFIGLCAVALFAEAQRRGPPDA